MEPITPNLDRWWWNKYFFYCKRDGWVELEICNGLIDAFGGAGHPYIILSLWLVGLWWHSEIGHVSINDFIQESGQRWNTCQRKLKPLSQLLQIACILFQSKQESNYVMKKNGPQIFNGKKQFHRDRYIMLQRAESREQTTTAQEIIKYNWDFKLVI